MGETYQSILDYCVSPVFYSVFAYRKPVIVVLAIRIGNNFFASRRSNIQARCSFNPFFISFLLDLVCLLVLMRKLFLPDNAGVLFSAFIPIHMCTKRFPRICPLPIMGSYISLVMIGNFHIPHKRLLYARFDFNDAS